MLIIYIGFRPAAGLTPYVPYNMLSEKPAKGLYLDLKSANGEKNWYKYDCIIKFRLKI